MSFHDIIQAYERIKQDFHNRATGAKDVHAAVFYEFHPVIGICNIIVNYHVLYKIALVYNHFPGAIMAPLNAWILPIGCVHPWAAVDRYIVQVNTQSKD